MSATQDVREVLKGIEALSGIVDSLGDDDDLFERGMDSFASVQLMLALEERFDIEFPDNLLTRRSFSTIRIIGETVTAISLQAAA